MDSNDLISVFANLKLSIGDLHQSIKDQSGVMRRLAKSTSAPVMTKVPFSVKVNSTGFGVAKVVDAPPQGYFAYVRRISVSLTTAHSGTVYIVITAMDLSNAQSLALVSDLDTQDSSTTIPNNAFYSRGEMGLRFNERLFVVINGGLSGDTIPGNITLEHFQEGATGQETAI